MSQTFTKSREGAPVGFYAWEAGVSARTFVELAPDHQHLDEAEVVEIVP